MERSQVQKELAELGRNVAAARKLLGEIEGLDADRAGNVASLAARLDKLQARVEPLEAASELGKQLGTWLVEYRAELAAFREEQSKRFGVELEQELCAVGLGLTGHYPELRSGAYTIALDLERWQVTVWWGPKQERLGSCAMSPKAVAELVVRLRSELGSHVDEAAFVERLGRALDRAQRDGDEDGMVPIIIVLGELALLMQSRAFLRDPQREAYRSYSRADLSSDLCRFNHRVQMRVATRALARSRDTFLWVPSDARSGDGAVYSHVRLRKETS
ncbi:MAG: hypothetical protein GX601_15980 [Anaerolineales bacterium]|jgi:hypothetical protein|nr:hypothetical protein [Anaerolineales bacterium]